MNLTDIKQDGERTLALRWDDKTVSGVDVVLLRKLCPCAHCVSEWTGERTLDPESIKDSVRPTQVRPVGRYALSVHFSDGHSTGIYSYEYLREISQGKVSI